MRVCACILRQAHGEASLIWSPSHFLPSSSNRTAHSLPFSVLLSSLRVSHRGVSLRPPQLHNHCSDRVEHAFARVTAERATGIWMVPRRLLWGAEKMGGMGRRHLYARAAEALFDQFDRMLSALSEKNLEVFSGQCFCLFSRWHPKRRTSVKALRTSVSRNHT